MSVVDEPWCKGQQRAEEQVEPRQVVAIVPATDLQWQERTQRRGRAAPVI